VQDGVIDAYVKSDTPKSNTSWIAEQVCRLSFPVPLLVVYKMLTPIQTWGFEQINDERRYVRHVDFIGPESEHIQACMVYDFCELVLQLAWSTT